MGRKFAEDQNDVENVEAWAEVIEDLLYLVPPGQRAAVLALASKNEEAEAKEREAHGGFRIWSATELEEHCKGSPGLRHWDAIMRLESLVVQMFVRHITNNHSAEDAARILFAQHRYGHGSGRLQDYLSDLPTKPPKT
jgi:hypothetical protein